MPEGGRVEIRADNLEASRDPILGAGRYVCVSIKDHGPGIPPELRSRIFDPFFTTREGGSGLGLSTARSIVRRHNGHIEFDSVAGQGTTFRVYLPASSGSPGVEEQKEPPAPTRGRVLVMDDEEFVREVARESLDILGLRVEVVSDGAAALAAAAAANCAKDPFDLVILDLTIAGGMGGVETLARIREVEPSVKAIASSGYSSDPVMAAPTSFGFQGTLPKPYSIDDLARVLAAVLGTGDRE
jgi:CheY-like chemotaxis protein